MPIISQLVLDGRHREVARLLGDSYALHCFVYRAFPAKEDGGAGRVLYRADFNQRDASVNLIVQSDCMPNWSYASRIASRIDGPKEWTPSIASGSLLRFRLRATPTKRIALSRDDPQRGNRREGLLQRDQQIKWLTDRAASHGFEIAAVEDEFQGCDDDQRPQAPLDLRVTPLGLMTGRKASGQLLSWTAAEYEGVLRVLDSALFEAAISNGIGPAKGFGFGLLSLRRV